MSLAALAQSVGNNTLTGDAGVGVGARDKALEALGKFTNHDWNGFTSQEFLIEIVPKFTMPPIPGIGVTYGPFYPNTPIEVPLWLALFLRGTSTCVIKAPPFLTVPFLSAALERDRTSDTAYEALPFYFFEVASQIIAAAKEDLSNPTEIIRLVQEIRATRRQKLSRTVAGFQQSASLALPGLQLTNFVCAEIEYLRTSLVAVFDMAEGLELKSQPMEAPDIAVGSPSAAPSHTSGTVNMSTTGISASTPRTFNSVSQGRLSSAHAVRSDNSPNGPESPESAWSPDAHPHPLPETPSADTSLSPTSQQLHQPSSSQTTQPAPKKRRTLRG